MTGITLNNGNGTQESLGTGRWFANAINCVEGCFPIKYNDNMCVSVFGRIFIMPFIMSSRGAQKGRPSKKVSPKDNGARVLSLLHGITLDGFNGEPNTLGLYCAEQFSRLGMLPNVLKQSDKSEYYEKAGWVITCFCTADLDELDLEHCKNVYKAAVIYYEKILTLLSKDNPSVFQKYIDEANANLLRKSCFREDMEDNVTDMRKMAIMVLDKLLKDELEELIKTREDRSVQQWKALKMLIYEGNLPVNATGSGYYSQDTESAEAEVPPGLIPDSTEHLLSMLKYCDFSRMPSEELANCISLLEAAFPFSDCSKLEEVVTQIENFLYEKISDAARDKQAEVLLTLNKLLQKIVQLKNSKSRT